MRPIALFLFLFALAAPHAALAAEAPVIVVVSERGGLFATRVSAELGSLGFRVVMRSAQRREVPDDTEAVVRVLEGRLPRVRIERPVSDTSGARSAAEIDGDEEGDVGAIQISERVRAYFEVIAEARPGLVPNSLNAPVREPPRVFAPPPSPIAANVLPPTPAPSPPDFRASPAVANETWGRPTAPFHQPDRAPSRPRSWSLGLSAGLTSALDVGGAGFGAEASLYWSPVEWLRLSPFVAIPIAATKVSATGGSASLYTGLIGGAATLRFVDTRPVGLYAGGGFTGIWLRAVGHPTKGFTGHVDDTFTSALFLQLLGRIHLGSTVSIAPQANLGFALAEPDVRFGTKSVARWGLPWALFALGIEADLIH